MARSSWRRRPRSAVVAAGIIIFNTIAGSFQQTYCPPSMLGRVSAGMRFRVHPARRAARRGAR
jgi:hypothetical protein